MTKDKHLQLLDTVSSMLIDFANANNLDLSESFKNVQDFKDFVVGFAFKGLTDAGATVEQAFDMINGEGSYEKLFASVTSQNI